MLLPYRCFASLLNNQPMGSTAHRNWYKMLSDTMWRYSPVCVNASQDNHTVVYQQNGFSHTFRDETNQRLGEHGIQSVLANRPSWVIAT
ncbi:hypothetical protein OK016_02990 [Vibrio chagasii]|nr:hypothetical protein [Vibrio chagasii]